MSRTHLVVTSPFGPYTPGAVITDEVEMARVEETANPSQYVRVATPAAMLDQQTAAPPPA